MKTIDEIQSMYDKVLKYAVFYDSLRKLNIASDREETNYAISLIIAQTLDWVLNERAGALEAYLKEFEKDMVSRE